MFPLNNKYREKLNPCMSRLVWLTCSNSIYMYQYWQGTSVMSKCRTGPNYSSLQWHEAVIDLLFWLCVTITMIQEDYSWDLLLQYFCCRFKFAAGTCVFPQRPSQTSLTCWPPRGSFVAPSSCPPSPQSWAKSCLDRCTPISNEHFW